MLIRPINAKVTAFVLALFCLLPPGVAQAISAGQFDDFEDNTLQGWQMGFPDTTATRMSNIVDGGPAGVGDNYLMVTSDSSVAFGGSRLTFFNRQQWMGDYIAAGITAIAMDLKNLSVTEALNIRLAINGGTGPSTGMTGGVFTSAASVSLDTGSGWTRAVFSLLPADLVAIDGGIGGNTPGNDVQATLGNVLELRLLNSADPDWSGLRVTAALGVDNIQAVPLPPAFALFVSGLVVLLLGRRKKSGLAS